jgi:hypothetical protein
MSIYDELLARVNEKPPRLYEFYSQSPGTLPLRRMWLSEDLYLRTKEPWDSEEFAYLRSLMERFVSGGRISLRFPPSKDVEAPFALLDEQAGIWAVRSRESNPQLRAFGGFAQTNNLVTLTWERRPNIKTEADWEFEIKKCQAEWRKLFVYQPITGPNPYDYVARNFYVV